jgi:hypothetical protein
VGTGDAGAAAGGTACSAATDAAGTIKRLCTKFRRFIEFRLNYFTKGLATAWIQINTDQKKQDGFGRT